MREPWWIRYLAGPLIVITMTPLMWLSDLHIRLRGYHVPVRDMGPMTRAERKSALDAIYNRSEQVN